MTIRYLWPVLLTFLVFNAAGVAAQNPLPDEDALEVLAALEESDLALESFSEESTGNSMIPFVSGMKGHWDSGVAITDGGNPDVLSRLKMHSSRSSLRARWRRNKEGIISRALTAGLEMGAFDLHFGGVGLAAGSGLLVSNPGRGAGLAAGQGVSGPTNRIKGWAALPVRQSAVGVAGSWHSSGWMVMGLYGALGDPEDQNTLTSAFVQKRMGSNQLSVGFAQMGNQQGLSLNGQFSREQHRLGFEWVLWETPGQQGRHGVWLVTIKTLAVGGIKLESQWAASNGTAGPLTGIRPPALDTWAGSGWVMRILMPPLKSWRVKLLYADSRGLDWIGSHQKQRRQFVDLIWKGRPLPEWQFSGRWHHRVRTREGWSEEYPWLPPRQTSKDQRAGLSLDLKTGKPQNSWIISLRSLGRQGAVTSGRRSLFLIRNRRDLGQRFSLLLSMASAWGDAVDLVTAISPVRGTLLPRHWGHWSSEILVGAEYSIRNLHIMAAASRREPAMGQYAEAENYFWSGMQARW